MKYILVLRQDGGCDYTIGCGIKLVDLKSESQDDARVEAVAEIGDDWKADHEYAIQRATLLEVSTGFDLAPSLDAAKEQRKAAASERARALEAEREEQEFERLRRKLGK